MLRTSAIQLRALVVGFESIHTGVQCLPEHPRSQQLRDMSKSNPSVGPMRLGVTAVFGRLKVSAM